MSLTKSTAQADSARPECLCVQDCNYDCAHRGRWHNHADEVCPVHPDTVVD